ncbi:hypothetical protein N656DRAFT_331660 [Canariomyces notabilis]|uniref:Uncharacterized protein n=1 Tax=Canariomyces notabilis TaxID=2074819 RepID=A0AAN6T9D0_9PEZI|nr:hypothetical protein N656DRAFT_331660 [Canariomyces arenarius]
MEIKSWTANHRALTCPCSLPTPPSQKSGQGCQTWMGTCGSTVVTGPWEMERSEKRSSQLLWPIAFCTLTYAFFTSSAQPLEYSKRLQ